MKAQLIEARLHQRGLVGAEHDPSVSPRLHAHRPAVVVGRQQAGAPDQQQPGARGLLEAQQLRLSGHHAQTPGDAQFEVLVTEGSLCQVLGHGGLQDQPLLPPLRQADRQAEVGGGCQQEGLAGGQLLKGLFQGPIAEDEGLPSTRWLQKGHAVSL